MKQTKITYNLKGVEDLAAALSGSGYVARVGILGERATRNSGGINNATLGLIHEVGSETQGIPARSFLRMPMEHEADALRDSMRSSMVQEALEKRNYKRIFQILGLAGEKAVQKAFATGGFGSWPALKRATVIAKGSSKILINTSQLRRAVTSDVVRKGDI